MKIRALVALLALSACLAFGQVDPELQKKEKSEVEKLAKLPEFGGGTIFFGGVTIDGFIRDGKPRYFAQRESCGHYIVSMDARFLAITRPFGERKCQVAILNLSTLEERALGDGEAGVPLSWSWDDSSIVGLYGGQVQIRSVAAGTSTSTLTFTPANAHSARVWNVQFLHSGDGVLVDSEVCIPTKEPGECENKNMTFLVKNGETHKVANGSGCAVSPKDDTIACVTDHRVTLFDLAGHLQKRLSRTPRGLFVLPIREDPWGQIVWSQDASKIIYSTIIDEGGNTNIFIVDTRTGDQQRILKRSSLRIVAWR